MRVWNLNSFQWLYGWVVGFVGAMVGTVVIPACTAPQRQIVRSVLDLADQVCGDNDSLEQCLHKCQDEAARRGK